MDITKTTQGYTISEVIDGYRQHKHYIGYTRQQAVAKWHLYAQQLLTTNSSTPNEKERTA